MTERCLSCCEALDKTAANSYHRRCAKRLFGVPWQPILPFGRADIIHEAEKMIGRLSISGVQPKLSALLDKKRKELIVSTRGGEFIVKPPHDRFSGLPENEHLCMNIVEAAGMQAPPHGLLPLSDMELAYVVKRFDRTPEGKIHVEDLSQLMDMPPGSKYDSSMERMGRAIAEHSENPLLDLIEVFERALLSYLIGNGDMHLKNWSLIESTSGRSHLSPCYDFCSSTLVLPRSDELALPINGRQNKVKRKDFEVLANSYGIEPQAIKNSFSKLSDWRNICLEQLKQCFLSEEQKKAFESIVNTRYERLKQ